MEVEKNHPLAIEYRCRNGHKKFYLVPMGAWPLPVFCECGEKLFPLADPSVSEQEKVRVLNQWLNGG